MRFEKTLFVFAMIVATAGTSLAQSPSVTGTIIGVTMAQKKENKNKSLGEIKGKVRVETGTPDDVTVVVRRGEMEITRLTTNKKGEFLVSLAPGIYGLTFRKPGLSIGSIEEVEVKAGKTRSLGDRLILTIDEGSIAFLSGSVFNPAGRSIPNAKVELSRILEDGSTKKIDSRITTETGSFKFRLSPELGKYRVSVKPDGSEPVTKDVEIDGAAVYRVALNLPAKPQ